MRIACRSWLIKTVSIILGAALTTSLVQQIIGNNLILADDTNELNSVTEYTILINSGNADAATATEGTVITITADLAPEGKEFDKWEVVSPSTLVLLDETNASTTFTMPAENVEISAIYKDVGTTTCTVTFDSKGHGNTLDAQTVSCGDTIEKPSDLTAEGYTFLGWCSDEECSTEYDFSQPVTSDLILYAKWIQGIAINETNFPDDIFRQYVSSNLDGNSDNYLSETEIGEVKSINIDSLGIESLVGIAIFTDLTELHCSSNKLSELDVSNNTKLIRLDCSNNQLAELNVSSNQKLENLNCGSNQLSDLNVTDNTNLSSLYCANNQLTGLNVSNNTKLVGLDCSNNLLTSLNVSNNTILWSLYCGNNQLEELNVSQNKALENLSCYNNVLTELNVSANTKLYNLFCYSNQLSEINVSSNTLLNNFSCKDNQIAELDLSTNTKLWYLDCGYNQLTELNVDTNTELKTLRCNNNQLSELDISSNPNLYLIWCANNDIVSLDISHSSSLYNNYIKGKILFGSELVNDPYIWIDEDTTIVASPNMLLVSFESNGGSAIAIQSVAEGSKVLKPSNPTKVGYTFDGWYTDEACTKSYNFNSTVTTDLTLYAKWTINKYTVTFNMNGHGGYSNSSLKVQYGNSVSGPQHPMSDKNYIFDGWYTDSSFNQKYDFSLPVTDNITLYAKWTACYTVTFNPQRGDLATTSQKVPIGSAAKVPYPPSVSYNTFCGWYTDAACTKEYDFNSPVTANITLYAKWLPNYTVRFYVDNIGKEPSTQTVCSGSVANKPNDPAASGYVFCGWFTDSSYTKPYDFNSPVTGNLLLYAKWIKTFTVTFNANGHGKTTTQTVLYNNTVIKPSNPTETGYTFDGWYTDIACTKAYSFSSQVTSNINLYAKWTPITYYVAFNSNGYGATPTTQAVPYGNKAIKPADPSTLGFVFGGWYTDSACTTAYDFNSAVTCNISLYAKWDKIETPKLTTGVAHVQDIGDVSVVANGDGVLTIGTTGMGKRLEQITINFVNNTPYSGTLQYRVHVQDIGWMEWVDAGQKCGTEGLSKRIEAIEIRLTGELAEYYSVEYCVHIQDYGDMQGWVKDGALAGTTGESKRIEELKIKIVPIGTDSTMSVMYRVHVQDYGWEKSYASNGAMSGTSGEAKRLEGIELFLSGTQYSGGIMYKTHVQDYGWQSWCYDGEMSGTQGEAKRLEGICIELYGEIAEYYDIYYRVHAQDIGWMGWAKNGECAGTAGRSARLEGIQIVLVPKGSSAPGATYQGITAVNSSAFVEGFPSAPAPLPSSPTPASNPVAYSGYFIAASGNGECYHKDPNCSGMHGVPVPYEALKNYRPCQRCCH